MMDPPPSSRERLRIAMVPAAFDPRLNYQENVFARALHAMGHDLTVFTSKHGVLPEKTNWAPIDAALPFKVVRTDKVWRIRHTLIPWDASIGAKIRAFDPEVALLLAPNHGLGIRWMKHLPASCRVISGFSDIPWHRAGSRWRNAIKARWARRVFRRSSAIISATDDTTGLLKEWGGPLVDGKIEPVGLCFDPASLNSSGDLSPEVTALRARVKRMGAVVTRIIPEKKIDVLFGSIEQYLQANPDAGFVIGGFGEDEESVRVRERIRSSSAADRCVLLPLLNSGQIGDLFRTVDFTLWSLVSIGLYHSLACGCPVIVREGAGSAQHLVQEGVNGLWYRSLEGAAEVMHRAAVHRWDKAAIRDSVSGYYPEKVLNRLLDIIFSRPVPA